MVFSIIIMAIIPIIIIVTLSVRLLTDLWTPGAELWQQPSGKLLLLQKENKSDRRTLRCLFQRQLLLSLSLLSLFVAEVSSHSQHNNFSSLRGEGPGRAPHVGRSEAPATAPPPVPTRLLF